VGYNGTKRAIDRFEENIKALRLFH